MKHGSASTYTNHACRCDECRAAWAAYCYRRRRERQRMLALGEIVVTHGRITTYTNYGCRCADCTRANSEYSRRRAAMSAEDEYAFYADPENQTPRGPARRRR